MAPSWRHPRVGAGGAVGAGMTRRRRNRVYPANIDEMCVAFVKRGFLRALSRLLRRAGPIDFTGMTTLNGVARG